MSSSPTPSPLSRASAPLEPSPSPPTSLDAHAAPLLSPAATSLSYETSRSQLSPLLFSDQLAVAGVQDARRPSVQFRGHVGTDLPTGKPKTTKPRGQRKMSPPPPPLFQPRVSFDTFEKKADFIDSLSFSLIKKHKDYEYTKRSRTFLCGLDSNDYSEYALEWLLDELVDDGDEVVCLRVVEKDSMIAASSSVQEKKYRQEAEVLMAHVENKNHENKAINLVLEFAVGKVQQVIDDMIKLYEPAILIVGTRGRDLRGFNGLLPGSVSKYCLQMSPVPVIVVRPSNKRAKERRKREADPTRRTYKDILEKSGQGHVLDNSHIHQRVDRNQPASEAEAAAVAAAIGYREMPESHPLSKVESAQSAVTDMTSPDLESSPEDMRSPARVMKSPELQNLESPVLSEVSEDEDDDAGVATSSPEPPEHPPEASESSEEERKPPELRYLGSKGSAPKENIQGGPDFDLNALMEAASKK